MVWKALWRTYLLTSSFPRGQNPSLSPPNLFPIIYMSRDLDISLFHRSIVLKYAELPKTIYNIGSVNTEP